MMNNTTMSQSRETESILECEECVEPASAFGLIANETRLGILEALWRAEETPVRFTDLRKRVGMRDSAQFNYHLDKLRHQFIRKAEDGYELRHAGEKVVRAVLAGSFNQHPTLEPFTIDDPCVRCGSSLEVSYADEMLAIECPECGHGHGEYSFPPGGLTDRSREEVLDAFDQRVRHLHCLAKDGVCPECNGRMVTSIERGEECCLGTGLKATHTCEQCNHECCSAVGLALLDDSAVTAFHGDHGISLSERPYWTLDWCVSDTGVSVESDDPWRIEVTIPLDDECLRVHLDGNLSILDTERTAV